MFEKSMADKLKRIFDVAKVTFDIPGETMEQDCIFVEIEESRNRIKDGKVHAYITGNAFIYGMSDKMPFGYLSKAIAQGAIADTKDFYFFDFEKNTRTYRNIVQRQVSFVYFFDSQYDPDTGTITNVDFIEET